MDGVKVLDGQAMYNQEIKPTEGLTYRFTLDTLGSTGAFALDNISVVMFYETPAVDKITFQTAAGEFTQTQNVPYDASAVVLAFNQAMSEALMNGENIWLENAAGVKVGAAGSYDAAAYTYSIKPAKQLLPSMGYRICLSGKLTSALSGVAMGEAVQYGFTTKGKGIYMEAGTFIAGGKEVTQVAQLKAGDKVKCRIEVANESGAEKTLTLRFAVYKANQLVGITAKTAVVPANGGSLETGECALPSDSLQDVVLRAYLCDGFRPVGIEKELK